MNLPGRVISTEHELRVMAAFQHRGDRYYEPTSPVQVMQNFRPGDAYFKSRMLDPELQGAMAHLDGYAPELILPETPDPIAAAILEERMRSKFLDVTLQTIHQDPASFIFDVFLGPISSQNPCGELGKNEVYINEAVLTSVYVGFGISARLRENDSMGQLGYHTNNYVEDPSRFVLQEDGFRFQDGAVLAAAPFLATRAAKTGSGRLVVRDDGTVFVHESQRMHTTAALVGYETFGSRRPLVDLRNDPWSSVVNQRWHDSAAEPAHTAAGKLLALGSTSLVLRAVAAGFRLGIEFPELISDISEYAWSESADQPFFEADDGVKMTAQDIQWEYCAKITDFYSTGPLAGTLSNADRLVLELWEDSFATTRPEKYRYADVVRDKLTAKGFLGHTLDDQAVQKLQTFYDSTQGVHFKIENDTVIQYSLMPSLLAKTDRNAPRIADDYLDTLPQKHRGQLMLDAVAALGDLPEELLLLRWNDGLVYQTDSSGNPTSHCKPFYRSCLPHTQCRCEDCQQVAGFDLNRYDI